MRITHRGNMCNLYCSKCGVFLTSASKVASRGAQCKSCENKRKRKERKFRQIKWQLSLIDMLGGACAHCGKQANEENMVCFDFHHIDPQQKVQAISTMLADSRPYKVIEEEAKKCLLLCACCHRLYHKEHG